MPSLQQPEAKGAAAQSVQGRSSGNGFGTGQAPGHGGSSMAGAYINRGLLAHSQGPMAGAVSAHARGNSSSRRHAWTAAGAGGTAPEGACGTGEAAPGSSVAPQGSRKRARSAKDGGAGAATAGLAADTQALESDKRKRTTKRKGAAARVDPDAQKEDEGREKCEQDGGKPQEKREARRQDPQGTVGPGDGVPDPPGQAARKKGKKKVESGTEALRGIELVRSVIEALGQSPGFRVVDRLPQFSHGTATCAGLVLLDGGTASHVCTSLRPFDKAARQGTAKVAKAAAARPARASNAVPPVDAVEGEEHDGTVS